ncbi:membrane-spanning 4-domains subfamily A member 15-like [Pholidichthys leucotaenia]
MSVTVSKADGVTVITLTADPQSPWPPLCQIIKNLCYSPVCCSLSEPLRKVQSSQTVLATLQIMVGLLNLGVGPIILASEASWRVDHTGFPYWLGGLFILFGIICIFSEKYPSLCLIIITVILNLVGVAFAITGIVLYSIHVGSMDIYLRCDYSYYWYDRTTPAPSYEDGLLRNKCNEAKTLFLVLVGSMDVVMIILSTLQLCVTISSFILGVKALKNKVKGQNKALMTQTNSNHC